MIKRSFLVYALCILSLTTVLTHMRALQHAQVRTAVSKTLHALKSTPRMLAAHPYLTVSAAAAAYTAYDVMTRYNKYSRAVTKIEKELAALKKRETEWIALQKKREEKAAPLESTPFDLRLDGAPSPDINTLEKQDFAKLQSETIPAKEAELERARGVAEQAGSMTATKFAKNWNHLCLEYLPNRMAPLLFNALLAPPLMGFITIFTAATPHFLLKATQRIGNSAPMIRETLGGKMVALTPDNVHQISKNYLLDGSRITMHLAGTSAVIIACLSVRAWLNARDAWAKIDFEPVRSAGDRLRDSAQELKRSAATTMENLQNLGRNMQNQLNRQTKSE